MDFIVRLREQLKDGKGTQPWAFGFNPEKDSSADLAIRSLFKPEELLAISKHNPFIKERNKEIRTLPPLGLTFPQIVRLTGLSMSHLKRITSGQKHVRRRHNRRSSHSYSQQRKG